MTYDIICFGDSLTAGFQSPSPEHPAGAETPYGRFLQERLGPRVQIHISGVCGELTAEMAMRFRRDVLAHRPRYVVILGGTNDLGWNARPADVMRNLLKMYEQARADGIVPVLVTVPSIRVETDGGGKDARHWVEDHLNRRDELNGLIINYGQTRKLPCVDLFAATAEPDTRLLAADYSNDGLHLTTLGYRTFAGLLWDQVFSGAFGPHD
ncbi:MAG TPA: GDSL-type esterase/lipase family protein [Nitrospira sp.]|nr:GDSL-type esterase/lipase family protein [Nitrospira sp.]